MAGVYASLLLCCLPAVLTALVLAALIILSAFLAALIRAALFVLFILTALVFAVLVVLAALTRAALFILMALIHCPLLWCVGQVQEGCEVCGWRWDSGYSIL